MSVSPFRISLGYSVLHFICYILLLYVYLVLRPVIRYEKIFNALFCCIFFFQINERNIHWVSFPYFFLLAYMWYIELEIMYRYVLNSDRLEYVYYAWFGKIGITFFPFYRSDLFIFFIFFCKRKILNFRELDTINSMWTTQKPNWSTLLFIILFSILVLKHTCFS